MKKYTGFLLLIFMFYLCGTQVGLLGDEQDPPKKKKNRSALQNTDVPATETGLLPISPETFNLDLRRFQLLGNQDPNLPVKFYLKDLKLKAQVRPGDFQIPYRTPPKLGKRWGRASMYALGHFIFATTSYWIRQDVMREDWEYLFTWEDQKKRFFFTDPPRFDSNTFSFNWTHSWAGAMYYNYARCNRLNTLESFLYGFGASYFWEFFIEFREMVSLNDSIGTPMGGLSIGEAVFQVGRKLRSLRPTPLNQVLAFISNPIMSMTEWFDRKKAIPRLHFGAEEYWHDFRWSVGPRSNRFSGHESRDLFHMGLETQVVTVPEYGRAGSYGHWSGSPLLVELDANMALDEGGIYEVDILAKSILFGYFAQNTHKTGEDNDSEYGNVSGYSLLIGAGTAFELEKKGNPTGVGDPAAEHRTDQFCTINLLGPYIDFTFFKDNFKLRLGAEAYFDFSLVHSLAYQRYNAQYPVDNTKSTLKNHGYYYAWGLTAASFLQLNAGNLELKGHVKFHTMNSIENTDRFQDRLDPGDDFDLKDQRLKYGVSFGYRVPGTGFQLVLALENHYRKGTIMDYFSRDFTERRTYFQLKYMF